jgi:DNA-binding NarL/FixJ family response regulator
MRMRCGHILIVEDDASMREHFSCVLEGAGYETLEAPTGESALESAAEQRPALVVLDVRLPGVSGYEVCQQLRERFGQQLPIVFVSGTRTEAHDLVAGLLIGADDYVVKPFLPDELLARVRRLLVRADGEPEAGGGNGNGVRLTKREQEVLSLLADGLAQDAIATELYISPKTVSTHIQRILSKLGVHSRAEAVSYAFREGLVGDDVVAHAFA